MAVIIVPAEGSDVTAPTFNDTLQAASGVDLNSIPLFYEVEGNATLVSLNIGTDIEVDINGSLTGTGNVIGGVDPAVGNAASLYNFGTMDINGTISSFFGNDGALTVSAGEKLDIESDFASLAPGSITVASGAELDLNSVSSAQIQAIDVEGTLVATAPMTMLLSGTVLNGSVVVRGDQGNGYGNGVPVARSYVAALDLRQSPLTAPLPSLTLGQDASVLFGANAYSVKQMLVNGTGSTVAALDSVSVGGTLTVTGNQSGIAGQAVLAGALLTGQGTVDLAVSAADQGAALQGQVTIDANTTLRNDGLLTLGTGTGVSTLGSASAAAGSSFVNAGTIKVGAGATLSVASIQNSGTIDITSGTLGIGAGLSGSGVITVESGSTLALSSPSSFAGTVALLGSAKLDLAGVSASGATVSGGKLLVTTGSGTLSLAESGLADGTTLTFSADGSGGSVGVIAAASGTPPASSPGTGTGTSPSTGTSSGGTSPGSSTAAVSDPVYRFFDKIHGTHFFTGSLSETTNLEATRSDLTYEGVGLRSVDPSTDSNAAAVYRFFDTKFGTHFYTSSVAEKNSVQATRSDLTFEGVGFYEDTTQQPGEVPVYRYFDKNFGTHFYSSSTSEEATIAATRPDLVNEGISFYAPST